MQEAFGEGDSPVAGSELPVPEQRAYEARRAESPMSAWGIAEARGVGEGCYPEGAATGASGVTCAVPLGSLRLLAALAVIVAVAAFFLAIDLPRHRIVLRAQRQHTRFESGCYGLERGRRA